MEQYLIVFKQDFAQQPRVLQPSSKQDMTQYT